MALFSPSNTYLGEVEWGGNSSLRREDAVSKAVFKCRLRCSPPAPDLAYSQLPPEDAVPPSGRKAVALRSQTLPWLYLLVAL